MSFKAFCAHAVILRWHYNPFKMNMLIQCNVLTDKSAHYLLPRILLLASMTPHLFSEKPATTKKSHNTTGMEKTCWVFIFILLQFMSCKFLSKLAKALSRQYAWNVAFASTTSTRTVFQKLFSLHSKKLSFPQFIHV